MDNQFEGADTLAVECLSEGCPPTGMEDAIDSEMVQGADILANPLPSQEPTLMPSKCTVDNSPPGKSCDNDAKKTVHFANEVSMTNRAINQPTKEVCSYTSLKATTDQSQSTMEMKAKRQGDLPTLKNPSSSGDSGSNSDDDDNESDSLTLIRAQPLGNIISES